jgi:aspartate aminotransferase
VLPGSVFGDQRWRLRLRVATALLYGETDEQRNAALNAVLNSGDPCALPWIAAALDRLQEVLADLTRGLNGVTLTLGLHYVCCS